MNAQSTKQQSQHMLLQKKATLQRCNVGIMSSCFMLAHWLFWLSKNLVWLLVLQEWRLLVVLPTSCNTSSAAHHTYIKINFTHKSHTHTHTKTNAQNLVQTIQNPNSQTWILAILFESIIGIILPVPHVLRIHISWLYICRLHTLFQSDYMPSCNLFCRTYALQNIFQNIEVFSPCVVDASLCPYPSISCNISYLIYIYIFIKHKSASFEALHLLCMLVSTRVPRNIYLIGHFYQTKSNSESSIFRCLSPGTWSGRESPGFQKAWQCGRRILEVMFPQTSILRFLNRLFRVPWKYYVSKIISSKSMMFFLSLPLGVGWA